MNYCREKKRREKEREKERKFYRKFIFNKDYNLKIQLFKY